MLSTKQDDRFLINSTAKKLTLYIKNLIETIDAKIVNTTESTEAEAWMKFKQAGLAEDKDRIGLHKCVMGTDPPSGEPLQTSLKKIMKELMKHVPIIAENFDFQNIDNPNRNASLIATKKIMRKSVTPAQVASPKQEGEVKQRSESTSGWDTVKNGSRMQTRSHQKEVDTNPNIRNSYNDLQDDGDEEGDLLSEESTIVEELYNQFDDELLGNKISQQQSTESEVQRNKNKNKQNQEWDKTEIMTRLEYDTIENVIKQGQTNTLDLDILCKWIMHKKY